METNKPSTAQIIFNRRFLCQIQKMHTLTENESNIFGLSSSGDRFIDEGLLKAWVHVNITIAEMVTLSGKGAPLIIDDPKDSVIIYETLLEHLRSWETKIKSSINVGKVPIDDLRLMDEFANKIHPMAASNKPPQQLQISQGLQQLLNSGQKAIKSDLTKELESRRPIKDTDSKHTPIANAIAREIGNKTKY
jgi:hypothetical protein